MSDETPIIQDSTGDVKLVKVENDNTLSEFNLKQENSVQQVPDSFPKSETTTHPHSVDDDSQETSLHKNAVSQSLDMLVTLDNAMEPATSMNSENETLVIFNEAVSKTSPVQDNDPNNKGSITNTQAIINDSLLQEKGDFADESNARSLDETIPELKNKDTSTSELKIQDSSGDLNTMKVENDDIMLEFHLKQGNSFVQRNPDSFPKSKTTSHPHLMDVDIEETSLHKSSQALNISETLDNAIEPVTSLNSVNETPVVLKKAVSKTFPVQDNNLFNIGSTNETQAIINDRVVNEKCDFVGETIVNNSGFKEIGNFVDENNATGLVETQKELQNSDIYPSELNRTLLALSQIVVASQTLIDENVTKSMLSVASSAYKKDDSKPTKIDRLIDDTNTLKQVQDQNSANTNLIDVDSSPNTTSINDNVGIKSHLKNNIGNIMIDNTLPSISTEKIDKTDEMIDNSAANMIVSNDTSKDEIDTNIGIPKKTVIDSHLRNNGNDTVLNTASMEFVENCDKSIKHETDTFNTGLMEDHYIGTANTKPNIDMMAVENAPSSVETKGTSGCTTTMNNSSITVQGETNEDNKPITSKLNVSNASTSVQTITTIYENASIEQENTAGAKRIKHKTWFLITNLPDASIKKNLRVLNTLLTEQYPTICTKDYLLNTLKLRLHKYKTDHVVVISKPEYLESTKKMIHGLLFMGKRLKTKYIYEDNIPIIKHNFHDPGKTPQQKEALIPQPQGPAARFPYKLLLKNVPDMFWNVQKLKNFILEMVPSMKYFIFVENYLKHTMPIPKQYIVSFLKSWARQAVRKRLRNTPVSSTIEAESHDTVGDPELWNDVKLRKFIPRSQVLLKNLPEEWMCPDAIKFLNETIPEFKSMITNVIKHTTDMAVYLGEMVVSFKSPESAEAALDLFYERLSDDCTIIADLYCPGISEAPKLPPHLFKYQVHLKNIPYDLEFYHLSNIIVNTVFDGSYYSVNDFKLFLDNSYNSKPKTAKLKFLSVEVMLRAQQILNGMSCGGIKIEASCVGMFGNTTANARNNNIQIYPCEPTPHIIKPPQLYQSGQNTQQHHNLSWHNHPPQNIQPPQDIQFNKNMQPPQNIQFTRNVHPSQHPTQNTQPPQIQYTLNAQPPHHIQPPQNSLPPRNTQTPQNMQHQNMQSQYNERLSNYEHDAETYGLSLELLQHLKILLPLNHVIKVTGVDHAATDTALRDLFSLAGQVTGAHRIFKSNNEPSMSAIIAFDHPVEAVQAISMFNGRYYFQQKLHVKMVKSTRLPDGLQDLGPGLGPNGEVLKNVRNSLELESIKKQLLQNQTRAISNEQESSDNDMDISSHDDPEPSNTDDYNNAKLSQADQIEKNVTDSNVQANALAILKQYASQSAAAQQQAALYYGMLGQMYMYNLPAQNATSSIDSTANVIAAATGQNVTPNVNFTTAGGVDLAALANNAIAQTTGMNQTLQVASASLNVTNDTNLRINFPKTTTSATAREQEDMPKNKFEATESILNNLKRKLKVASQVKHDDVSPSTSKMSKYDRSFDKDTVRSRSRSRSQDKRERSPEYATHKCSKMLIFENLPPSVTKRWLEKKFKEIGDLDYVQMKKNGCAFVRFFTKEHASKCYNIFHRSKIDKNVIRVITI